MLNRRDNVHHRSCQRENWTNNQWIQGREGYTNLGNARNKVCKRFYIQIETQNRREIGGNSQRLIRNRQFSFNGRGMFLFPTPYKNSTFKTAGVRLGFLHLSGHFIFSEKKPIPLKLNGRFLTRKVEENTTSTSNEWTTNVHDLVKTGLNRKWGI